MPSMPLMQLMLMTTNFDPPIINGTNAINVSLHVINGSQSLMEVMPSMPLMQLMLMTTNSDPPLINGTHTINAANAINDD